MSDATLAAPAIDADEIARLEEIARRIRVEVIRAVNHARVGHLGGPLSAADLLAALYFHVLRIRPDEPDWPDRDRFILSKGHSSHRAVRGDGPRAATSRWTSSLPSTQRARGSRVTRT